MFSGDDVLQKQFQRAYTINLIRYKNLTGSNTRGLSRDERVRGKTKISILFEKGEGVLAYPYRGVFAENNTGKVSIMVSVPKRRFKHAVTRNLLRRRTREAFRLNKQTIYTSLNGKGLDIAILYIGTNVAEFAFLQKKLSSLLEKIAEKATAKR